MITNVKNADNATVSTGTLIVLTSLFVALFANVSFFRGLLTSYSATAGNLLFVASMVAALTSLFVLVLSALCHRGATKLILIAFLIISSVIAYFSLEYGTVFDRQMIANALQTDSAEAGDLLSGKLLLTILALGVLPSAVILQAKVWRPDWKTEVIGRLKVAGAAAVTLVIVFTAFSAHYLALMRERRDLTQRANPSFALYSALRLATQSTRTQPKVHTAFATDARIHPHDGHRELIVMVVGETVRADHWQLNGYGRETTPLLKQQGVINFPNFWACGTSTATSVPCMFSSLGHEHFSVDRANAIDNALDVLNRAGISVLWRDNNSSSKGVADRLTYQNFRSPKVNTVCDDVECRDEGMLVGLQDYIDKQKGDVLIVLHQMGSHGPAYYKRYPKAFEVFKPTCQTIDLGSCTSEEIANAYDNSIRYTDHFLAQVIALLKSNSGTFETAMMYVSDHGESLGEYGVYLHGAPYMLAPEAQRHVPAVIWLSDSMQHDVKMEVIEKRRQQRWSHDNMFATLLGMFEIEAKEYQPAMDMLVRSDDYTAASSN